jgi:cell migration-inducing and hyaluronan-binding protein
MMDETAEIGDTTIKMLHKLEDWLVGDEIVIATTDSNPNNAERRIIKTITTVNQKSILTFDKPLLNRHYSAVETYGTEQFSMRCEVGLLTRNILIRGNPADSIDSEYGAHLMIHGKQS